MFVHVFALPQNQLVDVCEKIQLQALGIEKFIQQTLTAKEQKLQVRNAAGRTGKLGADARSGACFTRN